MGTEILLSAWISGEHFSPVCSAVVVGLGGVLHLRWDASRGRRRRLLRAAVADRFSLWYCGIGPSIVATSIGAFGLVFGFVPKFDSPTPFNLPQLLGLLTFVFCAGVVVWMGEIAVGITESSKAQSELELRVQERTSDLDAVNRNLRELSARLMQLQDDERRRIARTARQRGADIGGASDELVAGAEQCGKAGEDCCRSQ